MNNIYYLYVITRSSKLFLHQWYQELWYDDIQLPYESPPTILKTWDSTEAYSDPCQTCKIEVFAEIVNGFQLLTIYAESSILDIWLGFDRASTGGKYMFKLNIENLRLLCWTYSKLTIKTTVNEVVLVFLQITFHVFRILIKSF